MRSKDGKANRTTGQWSAGQRPESFSVARGLLVLGCTLSLGGCSVSRVDLQKPTVPLPAALPAPEAAGVALPDPWWKIFDDARLNLLIDEALARNPDVAIAAARVEQARAGLRIANADRMPTLGAQSEALRQKQSSALLFPGSERMGTVYTVQGAVGYELDLWGRYARAAESARALLLNSEYGSEATRLSLTADVARGYYGLIAASEQLERARDTLTTREESLRLEQLRLDAGESDEFTFKRAAAEAAATRKSVHQLQFEVAQRKNSLTILLGRSPQDLIDNAIAVDESVLPGAVVLPPELPSTVLAQRPDIGAAEAALMAAAADIGAARAQLFPQISLTGAYGSASPELDGLFTRPMQAWSVAAGFLQPVFEGGRLRANVARTEAVREQRKAEYAQTVQLAFRDVFNALHGQTEIAAVRQANLEQVSALQRATELAELRYSQGDIAYLELLDVRRGLFQAEIDLIAAERDSLLNTVDLALAMGGRMGE